MAGVHVNEVSSIEAAIRLGRAFAPERLRGHVSILPMVNVPAMPHYTEYTCPIDAKNINFCFPGRADGTFSEALAFAVLNEWADDADVLIDMHGGDLRESVVPWVIYQQTGDSEFDKRADAVARSFGARYVEPLKKEVMDGPGRACTGRATQRRLAVMSEGGSNGLIDLDVVRYHMNGVFGVARHLGMVDCGPSQPPAWWYIDRRERMQAPVDGICETHVRLAENVAVGQILATIRDLFGRPVAELRSPVNGFVLVRFTHPIVREGQLIMSIAVPAMGSPPHVSVS